ncbi:MAG: hypothetical protein Unbinned5350contig1004_44 [Prokaryotic dsDNA virus sp.]|nr:MAG: hypothetical protein Unbinned5350contig1004_44 [Prokaryotic dsDNA virus sp.]|tara:strand:+ start:1447 stop:1647 length:201 start_codon:yes stop_codon:yes gene_type:complete
MNTITKVVFKPKDGAPVNCKQVEYLVEHMNGKINYTYARARAKIRFERDNKLHDRYKCLCAEVEVI